MAGVGVVVVVAAVAVAVNPLIMIDEYWVSVIGIGKLKLL
jgi:hypothetical protein